MAMGLERELGYRPRLRKRGPSFRSKRVGFWLRFRERDKARFSAMNLERERVGISATDLERERELTFNENHLHLERVLEIFTERKRAWRLEIDKLEILISILFMERECGEDFFIYIIFI